jgi:hypothetical protein
MSEVISSNVTRQVYASISTRQHPYAVKSWRECGETCLPYARLYQQVSKLRTPNFTQLCPLLGLLLEDKECLIFSGEAR